MLARQAAGVQNPFKACFLHETAFVAYYELLRIMQLLQMTG